MRVFVGGLVAGRMALHPWSTVDAAASCSLLRTYVHGSSVHHHATPWLAGRRPGIGAGAACCLYKPRRCAGETTTVGNQTSAGRRGTVITNRRLSFFLRKKKQVAAAVIKFKQAEAPRPHGGGWRGTCRPRTARTAISPERVGNSRMDHHG